jgi:hypothetical protein
LCGKRKKAALTLPPIGNISRERVGKFYLSECQAASEPARMARSAAVTIAVEPCNGRVATVTLVYELQPAGFYNWHGERVKVNHLCCGHTVGGVRRFSGLKANGTRTVGQPQHSLGNEGEFQRNPPGQR